ncbi:restriction endonuclease subunit S [Microbacterium lacticum]
MTTSGWFGEVPEGWQAAPLFGIATERKIPNKGLRETNLLSLSYGRTVRKDIETNEGLLPASFETYQIVKPDDIVLRMTDLQNDQRSLRSALVGETGIITSAYLALALRNVDSRFMAYQFRAIDLMKVFYSMGGGLRQSIGFDDLKRLPVLTPPLEEQRAIADYLDRETAQIDAFIAKNEELITLLTERRAASIDNAFEGLIENPTRLKYRASIQTGVTLGGDGDPVDPEWPYLRVANVQVGWVDLNEIKSIRLPEAKARQSMLRPGDVLMTEGGDRDKLGRGALWSGELDPMLHQNHVFAVRVGPRLDARFLMRWLDASPSRRYFETTAVQTTNLASTNKTLVGNLPLPSCSVNAQLRLVTELDLRLEKIDEAVGIAEHSVRLARERRAALISAAVTGKIDVGVAA